MSIQPPKSDLPYPHRETDCQEALKQDLQNLINVAHTVGWNQGEILNAAEQLINALRREYLNDPDAEPLVITDAPGLLDGRDDVVTPLGAVIPRLDEDRENRVYLAGAHAFERNSTRASNPYDHKSLESSRWQSGYDEAAKADRR